jgi:hypothetical protein
LRFTIPQKLSLSDADREREEVSMPDRISRQRAFQEGWLSVREIRKATGLGHATVMERFHNASRDGLRVARLETGEWRLHKDDLARMPHRYAERGAPRTKLEALIKEVETLRAEVAALKGQPVGAAS